MPALDHDAMRAELRAFAQQHPTPNTIRLVDLALTGQVDLEKAYDLAGRALADGLAAVTEKGQGA